MPCDLCRRKNDKSDKLYRWNGPGRSHCNTCHADWKLPSVSMHCVRCHLTFGSPAACELHERETRCEAPEAVGLVGVANQWGTVVYRAVKDHAVT